MRKKVVDIDLLVTSRNGDKKRRKLATFRWQAKGSREGASERPAVLNSIFVAYPTIPRSS